MKTFPIKQAIAIAILLMAIVCTVHFLPDALGTTPEDKQEKEQDSTPAFTVSASPEFRFSSKPASITLKDFDGNVIFQQTEFDESHEHNEFEDITIQYDQQRFSRLQLIVEWDTPASPYHFFDMEFTGYQGAKFATASSTNIHEDILLQW